MCRKLSMRGETSNACRILAGKSERKKPLGNLGADNRIILKWMWRCGMDLMAQDKIQFRALMNTVTKLRIPYKTEYFLPCETIRFSRSSLFHGVIYKLQYCYVNSTCYYVTMCWICGVWDVVWETYWKAVIVLRQMSGGWWWCEGNKWMKLDQNPPWR